MPKSLIRNTGYTASATAPNVKRALLVNSIGHKIFVDVDLNLPTATGGDKTGVAKIYVRDLTTGTLLTSWSVSVAGQEYVEGVSAVLDAQDNLHVAYGYHAAGDISSVRYRKLTASGDRLTLALGDEEVIYTGTAARDIGAVDIDISTNETSNPIVVFLVNGNKSSTEYMSIEVRHRVTAGTWTAAASPGTFSYTSMASGHEYRNYDASIACRTDGDTTKSTFAITVAHGRNSATTSTNITAARKYMEQGDRIYAGHYTVGTSIDGVALVQKDQNRSVNSGNRKYSTFYVGYDTFVSVGVVDDSPYKYYFTAFRYTDTGTLTTVVAPFTQSGASGILKYTTRANTSAFNHIRGTDSGHFVILSAGVKPYRHVLKYMVSSTGLTVIKDTTLLPWSNTTVSPTLLGVYGGDRGTFGPAAANLACVGIHGTSTTTSMYLYSRDPGVNITRMAPSNGAVIASPELVIPSVSLSPLADFDGNIKFKTEIVIDDVPTLDNPDAIVLAQSDSSLTFVTAAVKSSIQSEAFIHQGTWYWRARTIDEFGVRSSLNSGADLTFNVSHPPVGANLSPIDGEAEVTQYPPTGVVRFSWDFVDAYLGDSQTHYEITVYKDDITTVTKAENTSNTYSDIAIPSTWLDARIWWTLKLFDLENAETPILEKNYFVLSRPPVVTITNPAAATSSSSVVAAWTANFFGGRTQLEYQINLFELNSTTLEYNQIYTARASDASLAHAIPAGYIKNTKSYRVDLYVTDTAGLVGVASQYFEAAWTPPSKDYVVIANQTYFDTMGFVNVVVHPGTIDEGFENWNIYRRVHDGLGGWTLVFSGGQADGVVFKDYLCPAGVSVEYTATQVVLRNGDYLEQDPDKTPSDSVDAVAASSAYWLIDRTDFRKSLRLYGVVGDSYTPEFDQEVYKVIGRGRQVEIGQGYGPSGNLEVHFRTRPNGIGENFNMLLNPNLEYTVNTILPGWITGSSAAKTDINMDSDPEDLGPSRRYAGALTIEASGRDGADAAVTLTNFTLRQLIPWRVGDPSKITVSAWFLKAATSTPGVASVTVEGVTKQLVDFAQVAVDTWVQGFAQFDLPVVSDGDISVTFSFDNPTNAAVNVIHMQGAMLNIGHVVPVYFDGNSEGARWEGSDPMESKSYTTGGYSARIQRQKLLAMRSSDDDIVLRNPFGDIWKVAMADISVTRIAGMGLEEHCDANVPYMEIGEASEY